MEDFGTRICNRRNRAPRASFPKSSNDFDAATAAVAADRLYTSSSFFLIFCEEVK